MTPPGPGTRFDPLHPLSSIAHRPSHARRPPRIPSAQRTHRRLVRLGWVLLAAGPTLALIHVLTDAQRGGSTNTWWTYTLASYDITVIIAIIGAALVWRTPPRSRGGTER